GIVCDEGSNLVRLISQLENINFDDFETEEEESEDGEMEVAEEGEFCHTSSEEDDEGSNEEKSENENPKEQSGENDSIENFQFTEKLATSNKSLSKNFIEPFENVPYETEYDFQRGDLIKDIDLVIGSNLFPRFNCSAHKLNIAVRKAVTNSPNISELVSKCGKYVANFRKSKHMYGRFRDKKCTLSRQNFTRWNSTYRMLFSILKASKAGLFGEENLCPADINDLEIYIQILKPVFIMTNDIQSKFANISIIVPSILMIVYGNLDRIICGEDKHEQFKKSLMRHIISKFEYELNSQVYLVAAVLNVGTHSAWKSRSFGIQYFEKGIKHVKDVVKIFQVEEEKEILSQDIANMSIESDVFEENRGDMEEEFDGLKGLKSITRSSLNSDSENDEIEKKIEKEVNIFKRLITEQVMTSTKAFWLKNMIQLPYLYDLSLRLFSIVCSSAEAERFFSVTGRMDKKSANQSDSLLISRSFLKANFRFLDNYEN
ncbi:zinc finger BED domain-containing 4-like, partial [Brachionus plicatilis]